MCKRLVTAVNYAVAVLLTLVSYVAPARSGPHDTLMFFSGADVWANGAFLHGGAVWALGGLDRDGFLLKGQISGGGYSYFSGSLATEVVGREYVAQFMPGYRFKVGTTEVKLFAGADLQWHLLWPDDPGSRLRGRQFGLRAAFELWSEPLPNVMLAADGSISTLDTSYSARIAAGWRLFAGTPYAFYVGPEAQTFAGGDYRQYRFGAHVTGFKMEFGEWSAALGFARDSDDRSSAYARLGVLTRY